MIYTISEKIMKQYMDRGEECKEFSDLYAYTKGLEYALENLGKLSEFALNGGKNEQGT